MPERTRLMCELDNAILSTHRWEEVAFHRAGLGGRIADGAPEWRFVLEHHAKRQR
jgi:hypothetical protein